MEVLLLFAIVIVGAVFIVNRAQRRSLNASSTTRFDDAKADARQVIERLGGQVYNLVGTDEASKQALADASERFTAAGGAIDQANTPAQAALAKKTAIEGLYYVRAARTAMGIDPGPPIPELEGQRSSGSVTEDRTVDFEGRQVEASPNPSSRTPNYYPGGRVAGRPVPAGWYSEPWWRPALLAGVWGVGSMLLFSSLFAGMAGVGYGADEFESGAGDGSEPADTGDAGADAGDGGDYGDSGGDGGGDYGGGDYGGGDYGGGDFGGGDFGGGFDF